MKIPKRMSNLLEKCANVVTDYPVIADRGRVNGNVIEPFTLRFYSYKDLVTYISTVYISLRDTYTSCDSVLFHDLLKTTEFSIDVDSSVLMAFHNLYLPDD